MRSGERAVKQQEVTVDFSQGGSAQDSKTSEELARVKTALDS